MKRTPLLLVLFLSTIITSYAQDFTFGIKGGVNYNSIGELVDYGTNVANPSDDTIYSANKEMGYHFGAYIRMNYEYFYIRPEVNFTSLKSSYDLSLETTNWSQSSIDIPIFFGYMISQSFSVYAGPIITLISDRDIEGFQDTSYVDPWTFEKTNLNAAIGLNFQINRFSIDAKYVYSFTKVETFKFDMIRSTYGTNLGELTEYNPSQFIIGINIDLLNFGGEKKSKKPGSDWRNHKNL